MKTIRLPDLPLVYGCGSFSGPEKNGYSFGPYDPEDAEKAILYAIDHGITWFDTAPIYGFGNSESFLGKIFHIHGLRNRIFLTTKFGIRWSERRKIWIDNTPAIIRRELDESLQRLKTDTIDLYLMHWPDGKTHLDEIVHQLESLMKKGKIRSYGFCNTRWQEVSSFSERPGFAALQGKLSFFEQDEPELKAIAQAQIAYMGYETLAKGLLAGRIFSPDQLDPTDVRLNYPLFQEPLYSHVKEKAALFASIAREAGYEPATYAIAAIKAVFGHFPVVGMKSESQVRENLKALLIRLSDEELKKIKELFEMSG